MTNNDIAGDLQSLAQLVIKGDFNQVRQLATRQLVTATDEAHRTVLMLVADARDPPAQAEKCIMYLLELGADPMAVDGAGDTAAHLAARRNHGRLLALLPFASKWLQNQRGANPLMEAARTGSWGCAKHLLHLLRQWSYIECSETESKDDKKKTLPDENGKNERTKDPERPKNERKRLLGLKDQEGRTAAELAESSGQPELASYIERETRLVVTFGGLIAGLTSQEIAARDELQQLAKTGNYRGLMSTARRDNCDLPDKWGRTALMLAAGDSKCDNEALWKQMVQLGDATCAYVGADNSLHYAARAGNSVAASALLDAGVSANARDHSSCTPLMLVAKYAPAATARQLGEVLLHSGSDWSLKDSAGRTALDLAIEKGKTELVEVLRRFEGRSYFEIAN